MQGELTLKQLSNSFTFEIRSHQIDLNLQFLGIKWQRTVNNFCKKCLVISQNYFLFSYRRFKSPPLTLLFDVPQIPLH